MANSKQPVHAGSHGSSSSSRPVTAQNNAALTGAARAFMNGLPPDELARYIKGHSPQASVKPKPYVPLRKRVSSDSVKLYQSGHHVDKDAYGQGSSSKQDTLPIPQSIPANPPRSTPNTTAALAAARALPAVVSASSPVVRKPVSSSLAPSLRGRKGSIHSVPPSLRSRKGSDATTISSERADESSIPWTTSLVNLYEQKDAATATSKNPPVIASKPTVLQSPKPLRKSKLLDNGLPPLFPPNPEQLVHDRLAAKGLLKNSQTRPAVDDEYDTADSFTSAKEVFSPVKLSKPPLPLPRKRNGKQDGEKRVMHELVRPDIQLEPPSQDTSVTAPDDIHHTSHRQPSMQSLHSHSSAQPSIAAAFHQLHPRRLTPLTTGDSLADAIVASSLASSRAPSPHKTLSRPPPRHKPRSGSHTLFTRTPSPPKKGMRQTMRKWSSDSSDSEEDPYAKHKKKKRFLRKHPNKHHEGDRKRWRDAITERERKRYEGVWAANKGIQSFYTPEEQSYLDRHPDGEHAQILRESVAEQVTNIVARDIWLRSRLPEAVLEHVWDLVDTQSNGRLLKEEFVVGLWLIDQCLKGRKLPTKVTESIWSSVRFLQGIRVKRK
ncbi:hypothetical protein BDV97DRAFT_359187 [Delphinella strobiligena]|nr:hypothetical protein BDV97DRAFT_359187 [Delphinella strobiligena]